MSSSAPITTRPRLVEFTRQFVQPPSALYVTPDDLITFQFGAVASDARARLLARFLHPTDGVLYWRQELEATLGRFPVVRSDDGFEGFLLGLDVSIVESGTDAVWNFASVQLSRPPGGFGADFHALCHGYFSTSQPLIWPGGQYRDPWDGAGFRFAETLADPGAGTTFVFSLPQGARRRLQSLNFELVTSAAAANRRVLVTARSQTGTVYCLSAADFVQTASLTIRYSVGPWGESSGSLNGEVKVNWPAGLFLRDPDVLAVTVVDMDVGDDFGAPTALWEEWFDLP